MDGCQMRLKCKTFMPFLLIQVGASEEKRKEGGKKKNKEGSGDGGRAEVNVFRALSSKIDRGRELSQTHPMRDSNGFRGGYKMALDGKIRENQEILRGGERLAVTCY